MILLPIALLILLAAASRVVLPLERRGVIRKRHVKLFKELLKQ
jgi:hypothetical protein